MKDIINRSEFNALMKYENVEFERNFQLKPSVRSSIEPSTSTGGSVRSHQQAEDSHDDIQVIFFFYIYKPSSQITCGKKIKTIFLHFQTLY